MIFFIVIVQGYWQSSVGECAVSSFTSIGFTRDLYFYPLIACPNCSIAFSPRTADAVVKTIATKAFTNVFAIFSCSFCFCCKGIKYVYSFISFKIYFLFFESTGSISLLWDESSCINRETWLLLCPWFLSFDFCCKDRRYLCNFISIEKFPSFFVVIR